MRTVLVGIMLAAGLCSTSCSSPTSPGTPETFTLSPGESASFRNLRVTFEEVVVDSRCPEEAFVLCIQGGDAFLKLRASTPLTSSTEYDVQVVKEDRRRFVHAGYRVEVTELLPKPFISGPITPSDYRLSLVIDQD